MAEEPALNSTGRSALIQLTQPAVRRRLLLVTASAVLALYLGFVRFNSAQSEWLVRHFGYGWMLILTAGWLAAAFVLCRNEKWSCRGLWPGRNHAAFLLVAFLWTLRMDPVGYKRVNKTTGKEVTKDDIVKGVEYQKGQYVLISEEEIRAAHPKSTQTIDIFSFVDSEKIPLQNIDKPYFLAPDKRGGKVYALLRETLLKTNKVALANVVLHTRQHLAALMPLESALVLVMLRWPL